MRVSRGKYLFLPFLLCFLLLLQVTPASSSPIIFGGRETSSNHADIDPLLADFVIPLDVTNDDAAYGGKDVLRVTLENNSAAENPGFDGYEISSFTFNTRAGIAFEKKDDDKNGLPDGLLFTSISGFDTLDSDSNVNGFGRFSLRIKDGGNVTIDPGDTGEWHLSIQGGQEPYTWEIFCLVNSDGYLTGAHVKRVDGIGQTGFVGVMPTVIPEPTSLLLLGTGVVGLIGLRRKVKK